jgi:predicted ATPase
MAVRRIVVTGGPGGGKTSVWRAFMASHGKLVEAVPEVATALLTTVFPPVQSAHDRHALQRAIFHVQRELESAHEQRCAAGRALFCDRGTPDGAGYWPEGADAFFTSMNTRAEDELARYDAVLFLETAAAAGLSIAAGNPIRTESLEAAVEVDRRLHAVWGGHPGFVHVGWEIDFQQKVDHAVAALTRMLSTG